MTENFTVKEPVVVEKKPGRTSRDELFEKAKYNRLSSEVEELYKKVEELKGVKKVVGD